MTTLTRRMVCGAGLALVGAAPAAGAIGSPYRLRTSGGQVVTETTYRGAWQIVFFGFANCPDICPTALFSLSQVLPKLQGSARTVGLFITIDPARDTPQRLATYISNFDRRIVGLRGSAAETEAAARAFRARYSVRKEGGDYLVTHSSYLYVIDPTGRFVRTLRFDLPPDELLEVLTSLGVGAPVGG